MDNNCPNCHSESKEVSKEVVLYKCIRCYTVYCQNCPDTREGHHCPKCGMSLRMVLTP